MSPWRTAWRPSSHSGAEIAEEWPASAVVVTQQPPVASPLRECQPERAKCPARRAFETFSTSIRSMSCRGSQSSAIKALKKPKPCQCTSRDVGNHNDAARAVQMLCGNGRGGITRACRPPTEAPVVDVHAVRHIAPGHHRQVSSQLRVGKALLEGQDNVLQRQRQPIGQVDHLHLHLHLWRSVR